MLFKGVLPAKGPQRTPGDITVKEGIVVHHDALQRVTSPKPAVTLDAVQEELTGAQLHGMVGHVIDCVDPIAAAGKAAGTLMGQHLIKEIGILDRDA